MEGLSFLLKKSQHEGRLTIIKVSRLVKILNILFVDDVLLMKKSNIEEWRDIDSILKTFFLASGLHINLETSTFHYSRILGVDLET